MHIFIRFLPPFSLFCRDLILKETFDKSASWGDRGRQMGDGGASRGAPIPNVTPLTTSPLYYSFYSHNGRARWTATSAVWCKEECTCRLQTAGRLCFVKRYSGVENKLPVWSHAGLSMINIYRVIHQNCNPYLYHDHVDIITLIRSASEQLHGLWARGPAEDYCRYLLQPSSQRLIKFTYWSLTPTNS